MVAKRKAWEVRLENRIDPREGTPGSFEVVFGLGKTMVAHGHTPRVGLVNIYHMSRAAYTRSV